MYQRQVSFGEAIKKAIVNNYCNFKGRSSRSEYWYYVLFTFIINCVLQLLIRLGCFDDPETVSGIVSLALLLPGLGVAVRRLHDIGKSAKMLIWAFVLCLVAAISELYILFISSDSMSVTNIVVGGIAGVAGIAALVIFIILIVWYCRDSEPEENKYGPVPNMVEQV